METTSVWLLAGDLLIPLGIFLGISALLAFCGGWVELAEHYRAGTQRGRVRVRCRSR